MRKRPKANYQTPEEIEKRIRELELGSMRIPADTDERCATMQEIAKLRIYAAAKRWVAGPTKQQPARRIAASNR